MKLSKIAAMVLLSAVGVPSAAQAQAPAKPQVAPGATVYGPQGGVVGKIEKVSGDTAVVNTGTNSATLSTSAFGSNAKGLTITYTQAQLNDAIEAANQANSAKLTAALVPGAALRSKDGVALGTVKSVAEDGSVVVEREAGSFTLQRDMFATDASGLTVRLTAKEIDEALTKAAATTDTTEATADAGDAKADASETPAATAGATAE